MLRFPPMATLVAALALAVPAAAQIPGDTVNALTPGRRFYSLNARALENGASGGFGIWRVLTPDRARGLVLNLSAGVTHDSFGPDSLQSSSTATDVSLNLGPRFRRYVAPAQAVAPFLESGFDVGIGYSHRSGSGSAHAITPSVGASVGAGAEWFPLRRISVAGQAGLRADLSYWHVSASANHEDGWRASLGTFISALAVQIYL